MIKGFGYSFSANAKDMDDNETPDFAIGAVSNDGDPVALFLRSEPTIAIAPMSTAGLITPLIRPNHNSTLGNTNCYTDILILC